MTVIGKETDFCSLISTSYAHNSMPTIGGYRGGIEGIDSIEGIDGIEGI